MNPTLPEPETGIPIPSRYKWVALADRLAKAKAGASYGPEIITKDRERCNLLMLLKRRGVHATSRKVDGQGYRIWKLAK